MKIGEFLFLNKILNSFDIDIKDITIIIGLLLFGIGISKLLDIWFSISLIGFILIILGLYGILQNKNKKK